MEEVHYWMLLDGWRIDGWMDGSMDGWSEQTINAEELHSSNALFLLGTFNDCDSPSAVVDNLTWIEKSPFW